ncbi:Histidine kinase 3 [Fusarium oxysporum f. sp. cubense race 1]|uniref:histidine kinase n=1 Tax=Fusarium oxysporum f. sp. cubense (strain race 1) TaxID=1229664 RepID=N4UBK4_FUSC1|nr:Histidine kinase 3 [Fusarium oxysporum f. sp. cubense race 1]
MASPACVQVPKKSIVSEATRERETFRYDDSLFTNVRFNDTGLPVPSNELSTSPDVVLTALARLAASQTGAARSMISLFDQTHQYIIAEASSITPLIPSLGQDGHPETLWHCGTAIPRSHSACESTLCSDEIQSDASGPKANHDLPVIVVDDVTLDPEYSTKPYCRPGGAARFYAAVPIRTDRGVNIGVICVIHTEPSLPWEDSHSRLMRELSRAVTEHLETTSLKSHQRRSERKSWGLTSFVEGNTAPLSQVSSTGREYAEHEMRGDGMARSRRPNIDDLQQALGGMSVRNSTATADSRMTNALHTKEVIMCYPQARSKFAHDPSQLLETPRQIFSKAASIVKDSIETDGCLFLNADMLDEDAYTTGSSDDRLRPSCQALGSTLLARMIRRYPRGHVFNYDTDGNLLQEELSDDSIRHPPNNNDWGNLHNRQDHRFRVQQREASILLETFPGARSIAFVPVWDLRKKRWSAGGFIHTYNIKRTFTIDLDLSYLRALGMLAAAEAFKLETLAADKAKTDALGSLSHELRSPLHGAVLSVELLNDTDLTIPQQNIVRTIETCCRTLSDTIDHLLEYSKVNKALPQEATRETQADGSGINRSSSVRIASKPSRKVVQLDVLAEEVLESVYAGFNFQQATLAQSSSQTPRRPGHTSIRRMDTMQAMEELQAPLKKKGNLSTKIGDVDVFLVIDSRPSWGFYTQPGPVRRIIMNLFGNSLKYTQCGIIRVSLEQTSAFGADDNDCWVTIKVSDTGVGISEDFLQNGLFKPFSQENHLSPGTGLGLSFVKQITAQFGGHISVDSRIGVGTTVTVRLPMKLGDDCHHNVCEIRQREEEFDAQTEKLRGLRVKLVDFSKDSVTGGGSVQRTIESPDQLVQDMCKEWLNMQVNTTSETPCFMPDLAIWSEEGFERPYVPQDSVLDIPNIVLCANAVTAHQYATGTKTIPRPGVFEFISQPLGPRKLAKACSLALYRWTVMQTSTQSPTTASTEPESLSIVTSTAPSLTNPSSPFPASEDETPTQPKDYFRASEFLLVDDNFINLKILSSYMKKLKQPYQTASDGLEAVTAYEADPGRYSCILMDISMPVMDGFEATRRIRAFESQQGLRPALILALTGLASEEAQREATVSGLDLFLTKPVRLKELGPILRAKGVLEEESSLG